jgi:hypothetical protein
MIWLPAGLLAARDDLATSLEGVHRALPASQVQLRREVEAMRAHVSQDPIGISVYGVLLTPTLAKTATLTCVSVASLLLKRFDALGGS